MDEMLDQQRQIVAAIAQRRHPQRDDRELVVEFRV